ncbi:MAG: tRNA (N(6)-L-threonylcarbamoyladenosine(37)-C(2))-methylthiotransferase MtaB [Dissulfurispiraceae bacterium]
MRISILTLGCKTNQSESFSIEGSLKLAGNDIVDITDAPDLCIINTCTVTAKADRQSRQLIYRALRNNAKVIVTGCYSELNADEIKRIGSTIDIIKNSEKESIVTKLTNFNPGDPCVNNRYPRHRPIVKVQDGCNFSCSYCAIPKARGRSRSESYDEIIRKINEYDAWGYKEVVLTGIHLGAYGLDLRVKKSLSDLLRGILKETSMTRIRLSSLGINEINDDLLDTMRDSRICRHLHIPLQSGDDFILKRMGRAYTEATFNKRLEFITEMFPDISIGTDVITGFPGEGDGSFLKTCRFIEAAPFSYVHVFPYSLRPGTRAATFGGQIQDIVKKQRVKLLKAIGESKKRAYLRRHLNKTLEILIENRTAEGYVGTSANYIKVLIASGSDIREETLINGRVTGFTNYQALAIPVNNYEPINI